MSKKTAETKTAAPASPKAWAPTAEQPWNPEWNAARRLLELRKRLRGSKLWAEFEIKRKFEAFSVHILATTIEPLAGDCGMITSFKQTSWKKEGNATVVEGVVVFEAIDTGEVREYVGVGESQDYGDKGMHKAISDARKTGFINALNLGIGFDKETEDPKAQPVSMASDKPTSGNGNGGAGKSESPANGAHKPDEASVHENWSYTLQQQGLQGRAVLGRDLPQACFTIISNSPTVSSLEAWAELNRDMLTQYAVDLPAKNEALLKIFNARMSVLREKGCL